MTSTVFEASPLATNAAYQFDLISHASANRLALGCVQEMFFHPFAGSSGERNLFCPTITSVAPWCLAGGCVRRLTRPSVCAMHTPGGQPPSCEGCCRDARSPGPRRKRGWESDAPPQPDSRDRERDRDSYRQIPRRRQRQRRGEREKQRETERK